MVQEYLIIGDQDNFIIEDYANENIEQSIKQIKKVQILTLQTKYNNEKDAKMMSEIHEKIVQTYKTTVLNNGCAEYFNKTLYPLVNEFERKLRRLLYLSSIVDDSEEIEEIENIRDLEEKDLGKIFEILFTSKKFNEKIRKFINKDVSWQYSKEWIVAQITSFDETTLWGNLLGNRIPELSDNYIEIREGRNEVMHAHNIDYRNFLKRKNMFNQVNREIDNIIGEITNSEQNSIVQLKGFNQQLSKTVETFGAMNNQISSFNEKLGKAILYLSKDFEQIDHKAFEKIGEIAIKLSDLNFNNESDDIDNEN